MDPSSARFLPETYNKCNFSSHLKKVLRRQFVCLSIWQRMSSGLAKDSPDDDCVMAPLSLYTWMLEQLVGVEDEKATRGRFLIRFNHIIERNKALKGNPWCFEKDVLILSGICETENPMHVDLDWCEFYVHVRNFPLSRMNLGIHSH
ncbi:hypothetical protein Salat_0876600 [Sesamum alatum]|uniref:DUF4283 domain-containing protein n=1 Tax=Sesamum alatum TaxID=300844 RepID=A0AAE1YIZ5_9LAMI|nr:hypothetical protein Salat_0876600 [Sesamum alatum]